MAYSNNHHVNPSSNENNNIFDSDRFLEIPVAQRILEIQRRGGFLNSQTMFDTKHKTSSQLNSNSKFNSTTPYVTPASEDEDLDDCERDRVDNDVLIQSLLNEAPSDQQPPRTSTPTSTSCQLSNNTSSSGASTGTNNRSCQNTFTSHSTKFGSSSSDDKINDDALDISRETDESALNQSGCEIVGVNDNSDQQSKESAREGSEDNFPYTVQLFNDTMTSSISQLKLTNQSANLDNTNMSMTYDHDKRAMKALIESLQNDVGKLKNQVTCLTSKLEDLETQFEDHKNCTTQYQNNSLDIRRDNLSPPPGRISKHAFSQSSHSINKTTPMKSKHGSTNNLTISRNQQFVSTRNSSGDSRNSYNPTVNISFNAHQQHDYIKTNRRANHHASTNSIYSEETPPANTSSIIQNRTSTSPSSTLNLSNRQREVGLYSSMLSLSSVNQQMNTLTRGAADSVANLSQLNDQLSRWPSMSNFVSSTHQVKDILYDEGERTIRMVLYNSLVTIRLPSWIEDYSLDQVVEPPDTKLKLDWVYGYRGRDCRSNLFFLPTGECIYFVASIVVLYNPDAKTQRHYLGHTDNVKCLAVHPNQLIVASGQSAVLNRRDRRPIVRVWNTVNLTTLRVIGFNEDFDSSICCLAFSKLDQGTTLAVVDESNEHTITLLDWQKEKNWRLAVQNSGHEPVLAIDFHPIDKHTLVAIGRSTINFWDIRGMSLAKKAGLFDKYDRPKYVLCVTFNDQGETITGDSNGNVIIWPRGNNKPRRIIHDVHRGGVFSILAMKDGSYLTGGRDRRVIEWDNQFEPTGREVELPEHCGGVRYITYARGAQVLIGTIRNSILMGSLNKTFNLIMQGHADALTALAIHQSEPKYLTGGFDDQIQLIDSKMHTVEWTKCVAMPVTSASFSNNGSIIVIGSTAGNWLVLNAANQDILFTACEGVGTISCVKFSPDGTFFCLGSSDSNIYIYKTTDAGNAFERLGTCVGHSAPIKEMDWSDDNRYLQSQSMNFELLFWKPDICRPVDDQTITSDIKWHTHNCTLGFYTIGIWPDSLDSALINHCDKSNDDELMVSATDTGYINMFRWPTCYNQCLSQKYNGNVDKFNFIRFINDDSKLIAVGSKSCVVTEWIVERKETKE